MNVGVPDKIIQPWLNGKEYIVCSDEGEAIAIGAGHFIATGDRANVFMSADGLCNALNLLTSWVVPDNLEMNIIISTGRQEPAHRVMTEMLPTIIKALPYDPEKIHFEIIT